MPKTQKFTLITGALGQLGQAISKKLKDRGDYVIGWDISPKPKKLKFFDEYERVDIRNEKKICQAFKKIIKQHGQCDILINNAGVSVFEPFEERSETSFDFVMDINLKGTFFCTKAYVKFFDLIRQKKGSIVNIASMYGIISPDPRIYTDCARKNSEVYGATKAGVIQMSRYFSVHLADRGIRVNCVSPGGVFNDRNPQGKDFVNNYSHRCPLKRMANDHEIASPVVWLSGDEASYVQGHNLVVDGGMSCW